MIVFDLECLEGHTFEGWFDDKEDLNSQLESGLLQCPVCSTTSIVQKLHAIAIKKSYSSSQTQQIQAQKDAINELSNKVFDYIEKNFEDVGPKFAEKALKMHYGAEKHKNIKGTTTNAEDKVLAKEGIPVLRLPAKSSKENLN